MTFKCLKIPSTLFLFLFNLVTNHIHTHAHTNTCKTYVLSCSLENLNEDMHTQLLYFFFVEIENENKPFNGLLNVLGDKIYKNNIKSKKGTNNMKKHANEITGISTRNVANATATATNDNILFDMLHDIII